MAAGDGLISMAPSSVSAGTGTAAINADGGIELSGCSDATLNGIFNGDFDNYRMTGWLTYSSGDISCRFQFSSGGTPASSTDYTWEYMQSLITPGQPTVTSGRISNSAYGAFCALAQNWTNGFEFHAYGPYLAQPTAVRSFDVSGQRWNAQYAAVTDWATTHSLSTSYDGLKLYVASGTFSGVVHVFGYEE